jgi:hypothetical protein
MELSGQTDQEESSNESASEEQEQGNQKIAELEARRVASLKRNSELRATLAADLGMNCFSSKIIHDLNV